MWGGYERIEAGALHLCAQQGTNLTCWGLPCAQQNDACWFKNSNLSNQISLQQGSVDPLAAGILKLQQTNSSHTGLAYTCIITSSSKGITDTSGGNLRCFGSGGITEPFLSAINSQNSLYKTVSVGTDRVCALSAQDKLTCWSSSTSVPNMFENTLVHCDTKWCGQTRGDMRRQQQRRASANHLDILSKSPASKPAT